MPFRTGFRLTIRTTYATLFHLYCTRNSLIKANVHILILIYSPRLATLKTYFGGSSTTRYGEDTSAWVGSSGGKCPERTQKTAGIGAFRVPTVQELVTMAY